MAPVNPGSLESPSTATARTAPQPASDSPVDRKRFALEDFRYRFGDVTLSADWRLLSGLTAANGFLTFGWSTAYMVELVRRTA